MEINYPEYPDAKHPNEFERGLEFMDFAISELTRQYGLGITVYSSRLYQYEKGESVQGWEFKKDEQCTGSGRLSIEVYEKSNKDMPNWTPSGILREDRTIFYVQGNYVRFYIFFKKHLQEYYWKYKPELTIKFGTIKTFYLPFDRADKIGYKIFGKQKTIT